MGAFSNRQNNAYANVASEPNHKNTNQTNRLKKGPIVLLQISDRL